MAKKAKKAATDPALAATGETIPSKEASRNRGIPTPSAESRGFAQPGGAAPPPSETVGLGEGSTHEGAKPPAEQRRLQDVLPEIKNLAQRVGGLKKLAEIVAALEKTKE